MTGYGAGAAEAPGARVTVEIRGVNQRVLDAKVAVPREYAAWETEIREGVRKTAQRGRVEVTVLRTPIPASGATGSPSSRRSRGRTSTRRGSSSGRSGSAAAPR